MHKHSTTAEVINVHQSIFWITTKLQIFHLQFKLKYYVIYNVFNLWFSDNQPEPDIMPTSPGSSRPGRMTSSKMTPLWVQRWNCRRYMAGVRICPIQVEFLHRSGNSSSGEPLLRWNWVRGSGGTKLWAHRMLSSRGQKNILVTMMSPVWKCLTLASPAGGIKNNSVAE